jgi:Zn ribbon nucleic-acid-binding protein
VARGRAPADGEGVHATLVECLRCGEPHRLRDAGLRYVRQGECPRCGYLGWAVPGEVSERARHELQLALVDGPRVRVAGHVG